MAIPPDSPLGRLLNGPLNPGVLTWIGVRPARRAPMILLDEVAAIPLRGLEGDRYDSRRNGPRQVTLIAEEDIAAISAFVGRPVRPEELRRNLVTRGINLLALKDRRFRIGEVELEGSGDCAPCNLMEEVLGPGGFNAMRGRGGLTARVLTGGPIRLGDPVVAELAG